MAELAPKDELTMHMPQAEVSTFLPIAPHPEKSPGWVGGGVGATLLHNCGAEGTKKDRRNETKRKCSPSQLRKPICGNCREIAISATVMAHRNDTEMHRKCEPAEPAGSDFPWMRFLPFGGSFHTLVSWPPPKKVKMINCLKPN